MKSTASCTVRIFSAFSSGISISNASSKAITSSTVSKESAPRSSTNLASGTTSSSSTPNCSAMIFLTRSSIAAIDFATSHLPIADHAESLSASYHDHSTIYVKHVTRDIRRLGRDQKPNGLGDVSRAAQPSQRDLLEKAFTHLPAQPLRHRRLDESRGHGVHGNAPTRVLASHRFRKADHGRLRSRIVRLPGVPHHAHDRGDVHHGAPPLLGHGREHGLGAM